MEQLDTNSVVVVGGIIIIIMTILAAKHERGLAAAASFGLLVVAIGLRYWRRVLCGEDMVLLWKFCVPESQVTPPF